MAESRTVTAIFQLNGGLPMKMLQKVGSRSGRALLRRLIVFGLLLVGWVEPSGALEVNLYTGTATHTIPIEVLPGTNGLQPSLALVYNSDAGNGWVGEGWHLSGLGFIERRGPNYGPAPTYTDADTYLLAFGADDGKLVKSSTDPAGISGNFYRTQIERFLRIENVSDSNYWTVTDKGGTRFIFGLTPAASQQGVSGTFRWYLEKVIDTHGNFYTVLYHKDTDTPNGDLYPKQIVYTQNGGSPGLACTPANLRECRVVDFILNDPVADARPDAQTSYRAGVKITTNRRLKRIEIKLGVQFVRAYDLDYMMSPATVLRLNSVSQLRAVTQRGVDSGAAALRFIFNYHVTADAGTALNRLPLSFPPVVPIDPHPTRGCSVPVDLFNTGTIGILEGHAGNHTYHQYKRETNDFRATVIFNTTLPSLCTSNETVRRDTPLGFRLISTTGRRGASRDYLIPVHTVAVIDMDGDGLPDVVEGGAANSWGWWRQTSPGNFADRAPISNSPGAALGDRGPLDPFGDATAETRFADMDGDGLIDVVRLVETSDDRTKAIYNLTWWRNLGRDAAGTLAFGPPLIHSGITLHGAYPTNRVDGFLQIYPGWLSLVDMNGDGLPDLAWPGIEEWGPDRLTKIVIYYYPNAGNAPFGSLVTMPHVSGTSFPIPQIPTYAIRLLDMNGDGQPDLFVGVKAWTDANGTSHPGEYFYYPNRGDHTFGDKISLTGHPEVAAVPSKHIVLADVDGDGFIDVLQGEANAYTLYQLRMSDNHRLLKEVVNPALGIRNVGYLRRFLDSGAKWVPERINLDGGTGQVETSGYTFDDPKSAGWPWNEFRGFGRVTVTHPPDHDGRRHSTVTNFHQDDAKKGRVNFVDTLRNDGVLFAREAFTYAVPPPSVVGVSRVDLLLHQQQSRDGTANFTGTNTTFANFDNYGQASQVTTQSILGGTPTGAIAPRVTTIDFSYNTSAYIVNKPSRTHITVGGTKTRETWFEYDGLANSAPPTKGDLTKQTSWFSGGTNPVVQHFYDTFGNRTGTIDAKANTCSATGRTVTTEYDPTYQTFPVTEINTLCHLTTKTYWAVNPSITPIPGASAVPGLLATVTDVNGVRTDSYWDPHGRPKATVIPPDTAAAPTTVWSYSGPQTFPSFTFETRRETVGGGTLDKVTYFDGLGRAIQTKSEAEAANTWSTVDTVYDTRGLVESVSVPYLTTTSAYTAPNANQPRTTTLYEVMHRPIKVTNSDGTFRTMAYNLGVVTETDEKNNATIRTYDNLKRLIKVQEPTGGGTTTYSYDAFDSGGINTRQITDAQGVAITTVFDTLGRKIFENDYDLGRRLYTYDANGNLLTQWIPGKNQTLTFTYDKLNRLTTKTYPDGKQITYRYDDLGRLRQVTDLSGSTTFTYDQRGRQTRVDKTIGEAEGQNLARNPGFESGSATAPSNWSGSSVFTWDGTTARSGAKSMAMASPSQSANLLNTEIPYSAAKTYTASAWVKTQALSGATAKAKLVFQGANLATLGSVSSATGASGTADWTQLTVSAAPGSAPAGTVSIRVGIEAIVTGGGGGTSTPETIQPGSTIGYYPSLAIDASGDLHASYWANIPDSTRYAKRTGTTWTTQIVEPGLNKGLYTSLKVDGSGNPHISYWDWANGDLKYAKWTGSAWNVQVVESTGTVGRGTSLALDGSGNPHISYIDSSNGTLKYAKWTGSAWSIQTVTTTGTASISTGLALYNGTPRIAYHAATTAQLKYAIWSGTSWSFQTVDAVSGWITWEGQPTMLSLVLDGSGNGRIAYNSGTSADLKYAAWTGSSWSVQTLDSTGDVGKSPSLAIDAAGNAHISYFDATNGDLKYAKTSAGGAWSTQTLLSTGNVGGYSALAIDGTGQVHIVYYEQTTGSQGLKYVRVGSGGASGMAWFDDVSLTEGNGAGTTSTTQTTYDSLNRVVDLTYPDGEVVRHSYNAQGLLDKVRSTTHAVDYIANLDYNARGRVVTKTVGNGKTTTYDYFDDAAKGPTSFRLRNISTAGLQNLTYTYDNAGNVSAITDAVKAATQSFGYDNLHRLTSAASTMVPAAYTHTYAYDSIGKMTSGAGKTFTYPVSEFSGFHAPISDGTNSYAYDANGNMTTKTTGATTRAFTWDADNRLVRVSENGVTLAQYGYDHAGQRVKKIVGSNTTVYIGKHYECTNGACSKFIFANGERIALRPVGTSEVYYYLPDHLGSTTVFTDRAGNRLQDLAYFPYGATRVNAGSADVHHKFTGQEFDAEIGLYYYGARYYDPALMRFISPDTISPDFARPQTLNRYSYVLNNPLKFIDPTGKYEKDFHLYLGGYIPYMAGFPANIAREIGRYNQAVDTPWSSTDPLLAYPFRLNVLFKSHAFIPPGGTMENVKAYQQEFLGRAIVAATQGDWKTVGEYGHFRFDMPVHGGLDFKAANAGHLLKMHAPDYPFTNPGIAIATELGAYEEFKAIACAANYCNRESPLNFNMLIEHATYQDEDAMQRSVILFNDRDVRAVFPNDPDMTQFWRERSYTPPWDTDFDLGRSWAGCNMQGPC
jgi:RHS repeat-associated protein